VNVALARRLRSGLAVPAIFALVATVIFVGLGTWQLQRKAWKEALIETLEQRLSAPRAICRRASAGRAFLRQTTNSVA
jgi:cytochrome oxidase assembly protein ShyY1